MSVPARAEQFVSQLCESIIAQVASGASNLSGASSLASIRSHLQSVFRGLPTEGAAGSLRENLLQNVDKHAAKLTSALEKAQRASIVASAASLDEPVEESGLFSPRDFQLALAHIDELLEGDGPTFPQQQYKRLLVPGNAPIGVYVHMAQSLRRMLVTHPPPATPLSQELSNLLAMPFSSATTNLATDALLTYLDSLVLLSRTLPLSGILDRIISRFAAVALTARQERLYQSRVAMLLVSEATRKDASAWADASQTTLYVARVRHALRKIGQTGFTGSLAGELMFVQYLLEALQASHLASKHGAAAVKTEQPRTKGKTTGVKRSRSRSPIRAAASSSTVTTSPLFTVTSSPSSSSGHFPFVLLFSPIFFDVVQHLSTGARGEGCESEVIRLAVLIRSVLGCGVNEPGFSLPQTIQSSLRTFVQATIQKHLPVLPLPLLLREAVSQRVKGVHQMQQLWTSGGISKRLFDSWIREFDGQLELRDSMDVNETEEEEAGAEEEKEKDESTPTSSSTAASAAATKQPARKKQKTSAVTDEQIDPSSASAPGEGLFFVDAAGDGTSTSATTGSNDSDQKDTEEERSMGRSMTKILKGIKPQPLPKTKKGGKKAVKTEESDELDEEFKQPDQPHEDEGDAHMVDAEEQDQEQEQQSPEPMEVDEQAEEEDDAPKPSKSKGKASKAKKEKPAAAPKAKTKAKKDPVEEEAEPVPAEHETKGRSKRTTKAKK